MSRGGTVASYAFNTGQSFYFDTIDEPRYVHWVDLINLAPNTTYYFVVGAAGTRVPSARCVRRLLAIRSDLWRAVIWMATRRLCWYTPPNSFG